ncbi:amidohydrolase family protein [Streptomyces boninensis]|uniref:amidohydrolase family protein n=1 Tax=Streptomyces boninensis TaxID=2039455 RepID=UPI003B2208B5
MIDFHMHIPAGEQAGFLAGAQFGPADFLTFMDKAGIDISVVLTHDGLFHPSPAENDKLAAFTAADPARMRALGTVDPRADWAVAETERCVHELGMHGLKLHPWLQGFCPHEPFMDPICEVLAPTSGVLIFHDGTPPYSSPLQIAALARRHPRVRFVLSHGGLHDCWREARTAVTTTPNLHICLCGTPPYAVRRIAAEVPPDQLLFGTDSGLSAEVEQPYAVTRVQELHALGLPDHVLTAMTETNPRRLLGLPARAAA